MAVCKSACMSVLCYVNKQFYCIIFYVLYLEALSIILYIQKVDRQVVGVGEEAGTVLTDSFHINEWRGVDFMELGCIDLWLTSTF